MEIQESKTVMNISRPSIIKTHIKIIAPDRKIKLHHLGVTAQADALGALTLGNVDKSIKTEN